MNLNWEKYILISGQLTLFKKDNDFKLLEDKSIFLIFFISKYLILSIDSLLNTPFDNIISLIYEKIYFLLLFLCIKAFVETFNLFKLFNVWIASKNSYLVKLFFFKFSSFNFGNLSINWENIFKFSSSSSI